MGKVNIKEIVLMLSFGLPLSSHLCANDGFNAEQQTSEGIDIVKDEAVAESSIGNNRGTDAVGLEIPFSDASVAEALNAKVAQLNVDAIAEAVDPVLASFLSEPSGEVEAWADASGSPVGSPPESFAGVAETLADASGSPAGFLSEPFVEAEILADTPGSPAVPPLRSLEEATEAFANESGTHVVKVLTDGKSSDAIILVKTDNLEKGVLLADLLVEGSSAEGSGDESGDELSAVKWVALDADVEAGFVHGGASDNKKVRSIFSALRLSARGNRKKARHKIAKFVIDNPKLISQGYGNGFTILHGAAFSGDRRLVRFLLSNGADPRVQTNGGYSPLDIVLRLDNVGIASDLAECGASCSGELFPSKALEHSFREKGRAYRDIFKVILNTRGRNSEAAGEAVAGEAVAGED
jgi:hypothetical protein